MAQPILRLHPHGLDISKVPAKMKARTHFAHRIDMLDAAGEIQEHLAGVEDYILAEGVWREAISGWPNAHIVLRQSARVVPDQQAYNALRLLLARKLRRLLASLLVPDPPQPLRGRSAPRAPRR